MIALLGRRAFRSLARLLAVIVLVAQAAAAAHACSPGERLTAYLAAASAAEHAGCHGQAAPDEGACLMHCASADQSLDLAAAALSPAALISLPGPVWLAEPPSGLRPHPHAAAILEPPIPIRLGSFRS
jgi:hypothetical protein